MKYIFSLPPEIKLKPADFVTFLGFILSVTATFLIIDGQFLAGYILMMGQVVADFFDGRLARMSKTDNTFGMQLDSFSDFYTIINTALLGHFMGMIDILSIIVLVAFIFAGMFRLSVFAIIQTGPDGYFRGVPTTMSSTIVSTLLILSYFFVQLEVIYFIVLFTIFAILMPSSLKIKKL